MDLIQVNFSNVNDPHPLLLQNIDSNSKNQIMKPRSNPLLRASRLALVAISFSALPTSAGTTWDGGATPNTNIDTAANWDADSAPSLTGTVGVIFQSANNVATLNVPAAFRMTGSSPYTPAVAFNTNFTLNTTGSNSLTLYGTNSGSNNPVLRVNSGVSAVTINAPIKVFATSPVAAPLGSLLIIGVNNATAANTALNITGGISLAAGSTATSYDIRYVGVTSMTTQAKAKIGGTISGLGTLANIQGGTGIWGGDLIIAGDQASTSTSNIAISSTAPNPASSARLVLGENNADDQTWNNITLNNVMNLAIGGNISANVFSGNVANTRITGASATGNISFNSGTIGANVVLGGSGTNQNDLSIIKKSSNTLTINSTTATYTGATTVEAGTLKISSATTLASPITVKAGATLEGEGSTSSSLTFDTGASTLSFDPTTSGSLTAASLVATGATVVASPTGATTIGTPYTVLTSSGANFSAGDISAFLAGGRGTIGGAGTKQITYTPAASASLIWKGNDITNPTYWDISATFNWNSSSPDRFFANDNVTFDNTASTFNVVVQGGSVSPGNIVFDNNIPNHYTVGGGTIGGIGSLTKNGSGTVTLTQASTNTFSGALNINAGILSISNLNQIGGSANTRAIQLGGGTLEYTHNTNNAQVSDTLPLVLNPGDSSLGITGSYVTGSVNAPNAPVTLRLGAPITGSGNFVKSGQGILAIGKNSVTSLGNTFSGTLTVTGGILDVRNPDSLGDTAAGTTISNAQLELFAFNQNAGVTFNAEPLTLSGNSYFRSKNEDSNSDIQNVWTGPVTISAGAVAGIACIRQASTSGTIANTIDSISANISSLELSGPVSTSAGSTIKFGLIQPSSTLPVVQSDVPQTVIVSGAITGAAAVETQGESSSLYTLVDPEYSGNTTINSGILRLSADNSANNSSSINIAASDATLDLTFGGTDTVDKLFIGGVQQNAGVYKATDNIIGSGTGISQITGTGTLTVTSGPAPVGGYSAWQTANSTGAQTVDQDHDNDGVKNGIEYFMGGTSNTSGFTTLPGPVAGAVTWPKAASYTGTFGTDFKVQSSTDLITWTDATAGAGTGQVNIVDNNVTYTLPIGAGKTFVRLLVNPN